MDWSANNQFVAIGSMDKTVKILYTRLGPDSSLSIADSVTLEGHEGTIRTVCSTVEQTPKIVSAGQDSHVRVWDSSTARLSACIKGHHS